MDTLPFASRVIVIAAATSTTFVPPLSLHNDCRPANHDDRQEICQLLNEYGHGNSGYCPSYLATVSMLVSHPTPIIRTNIFVRCIDRARQIPKRMRMICIRVMEADEKVSRSSSAATADLPKPSSMTTKQLKANRENIQRLTRSCHRHKSVHAIIPTSRLPHPPLMRTGCSFCDFHSSI